MTRQPGATLWQLACRRLVLSQLRRIREGSLTLEDQEGRSHFGRPGDAQLDGTIRVHRPRLYGDVVRGGSLAAADAYLRGDWDCDDLTTTLRLLARNAPALAGMERWGTRFARPFRALWMWAHRNSRPGSRRNIAAHYDLSNEFFSLMLDPTMTYSSGIFEDADATLEQASLCKYERICRRLRLCPADHIVEIGSGWGGFAIHAAGQYGCRVTTTTISREQFQWARERIREKGLDDRIELLLCDYRDLRGQYDKAVSIEMIEAVGEKMFDTYFRQCTRLLKPSGTMLLQAITIPDERYDQYRRNIDFINRYIFPGGFLPSFSAIGQSLRRSSDFRWIHAEDFAAHYARTLACWRENFWQHAPRIRQLGFDERFMRLWHYYLCYCEAGFTERQIGVSQILFARPAWRGDVVT